MLCASPQLWPEPTGPYTFATATVPVRADGFSLRVTASPSRNVTKHLNDAFALMRNDIRALVKRDGKKESSIGTPYDIVIRVSVKGSADVRLRLNTDESYTLTLKRKSNLIADITAHSFCGARHGFETLSQLIWFDPYINSLLTLEAAMVEDAPRFHYRGFLLDTSRNYFPVPDLMRTIDAMAACKMNTFHWHISDSQSFPLRLKSVPQLAQYGAYGTGAVYTPDDIRAIVHRASLRGVRVLIEVDAPAHVGRAWAWGPSVGQGDLAFCIEAEPWQIFCGEPPCGQLNPLNPFVYELLERIYSEIIELTGVDDVFHIGGDEVSVSCWSRHLKGFNPMDLWLDFTRRAMLALNAANGGKLPELTLLWSSHLTRSPYLKKLNSNQVGIQIWGASKWRDSRAVLDAGFRSVISHVDAWYLDCGFGSWRDSSDGHCGPYKSWQQIYEHRPWKKNSGTWRIEGGAVCQWTEQLGPGGLDTRVWPRAAALAERLWSDRTQGAEKDVYIRLDTQRSRLLTRGVHAAPLWARWCSHNPHACL
ncbi:probable beta-hexosaminidase fdl isoform X2 [Epargyreus clarus]